MKGGECAGVCEAHHFTATKRLKNYSFNCNKNKNEDLGG